MITLLGTVGALLGVTGVLAGTTGLPLGVSTACSCEVATPNFTISAAATKIKGAGETTITVKKVAGPAKESPKGLNIGPASEFSEEPKEVAACLAKKYEANESCPFKLKYAGKAKETVTLTVFDQNNTSSSVMVTGEP